MAAPRGAACRPCVSVACCSRFGFASHRGFRRPFFKCACEFEDRSGIVSRRRWYRSAVLGGLGVSANRRMLDPANWHIPLPNPHRALRRLRSSRRARPGASPARRQRSGTVRSAAAFVSQRRSWYRALHRADAGRAGDAAAVPRPQLGDDDARILAGSEARLGLLTHRRPGVQPGRYGGVPPRSAARWAVSAALRRFVIQPCADHRRCRVSTKSRPPRLPAGTRRTRGRGRARPPTPNPRATACARPRVRSAQIAQGSPLAAIPRAL